MKQHKTFKRLMLALAIGLTVASGSL